MPKLQAIGASLRVICRARKMSGSRYHCGFSTAETMLFEIQLDVQLFSGPETIHLFVSSSLMDGIVPMYQSKKYAFILSFIH